MDFLGLQDSYSEKDLENAILVELKKFILEMGKDFAFWGRQVRITNYSDLLLSFATAQWDDKDARKEINTFVDEINEIARGFNVNKDFVLKACLVLSDFNDILFKVDNFNKSNMLKIQDKWDDITKAIRDAMKLISSFGFNRENITSNNFIIPIAYYLKHIGLPDNFEVGSYNGKLK